MSKAISRTGWTRVAFDDVVQLSRERSNDPEGDGFERYVGLEHLEPGDLKIRSWGSVAEGTTFTNVFRAGQVLFGKRRAYQRKVALADFDGVCSGDIYVLEPKNDRLVPDLLPFICQTDGFFEHAVGTSAGSLSPRTNWDSLASYWFFLPSLEEQKRIAKVLTAATCVSQCYEQAVAAANSAKEALLDRHLKGEDLGDVIYDERFGAYSARLSLTALGELISETQYGLSEPSVSDGTIPMLRMMDLSDGLAINGESCFVDLSVADSERYRLNFGDVLFNRTNSYELVGRTGVYKLRGNHVFASYLIRVKAKTDRILPEYLAAFLNAPVGRRQVMRFATRAVSQTNVSASNLRAVLIPLPTIEYQRRVIEYVESLRDAAYSCQQRSREVAKLVRGIANEILAV